MHSDRRYTFHATDGYADDNPDLIADVLKILAEGRAPKDVTDLIFGTESPGIEGHRSMDPSSGESPSAASAVPDPEPFDTIRARRHRYMQGKE